MRLRCVFNFLLLIPFGATQSSDLCWKFYLNKGINGGTRHSEASTEENCKTLCTTTTNCFGADWNFSNDGYYGCWLLLRGKADSSMGDKPNVKHWILVNCSATTVTMRTSTTTTSPTSTSTTTTTTSTTTTTPTTTTKTTTPVPTSSTTTGQTNSALIYTTSKVGSSIEPQTNITSSAIASAVPTAIIAGVVVGVGGAILVALLIILVIFCLARRRRNSNYEGTDKSFSSNQKLVRNNDVEKGDLFTLMELGNHLQSISNTKEEFHHLPSAGTDLCVAGKLPANKKKNRFKNIWPYDAYRIKMAIKGNDENSDYINASYIQGYGDEENTYIAAQGPLKDTLNDFWRMIWEEEINRIVMLTLPIEGGKVKCEQYWPEQINGSTTFDEITVTMVECNEFTEHTKRVMKIQHEHDSESRLVTQLQCLIWKDKSVPSDTYAVLSFRDQVRLLDFQATGPMLVHCSAGVGRTGTFIATDILIEQAEKDERLSVFEVVKKLREQRMSMVQVLDQYKLLYSALLEWKNCGKTGISWNDFEQSFRTTKNKEHLPLGVKSRTEQEFKTLLEVKSLVKDDVKSAGHQPQNENKNRDMTTVPTDNVRIYLSQSNNQSNYINAVLMKGYRWPNYYILTQLPLKHTAADFWRMIVERNCPTIVVLEPSETIDESVHWPKEVHSNLIFGKITVTLSSKVEMESISAFQLQLKQTSSSESQIVHLYQLSSWATNDNSPESSKDVLDLIGFVSQRQQEVLKSAENSTNTEAHRKPVVIVCHDGAVKSGLFAAATFLTDKMNNDRVIDAYLSCRYLLSCRPQSIVSLSQYQYIYQLAAEYCQWTPPTAVEFPSMRSDPKDIYVNVQHNNKQESIYANGQPVYANGHLSPAAETLAE